MINKLEYYICLFLYSLKDKKFSKNVHDIYLLSQKDVGKEENLLLKPFYLTPFLIDQK